MEQKKASKFTDALAKLDHPLFDFRTKQAKEKTKWLRYIKPYINKNCALLDVGCGMGKQSFTAEKLGAKKVYGLDCSEGAIAYANKLKEEVKSNCEFLVGDYTKMPFEDGKFDIAIFPKNIVECSYEEIDKLCSEMQRILKPNGNFIVTMEDGLKKVIDNKMSSENYKISTGMYDNKVALPDGKKYSCPVFFWTIPFAKYLISHYFDFVSERTLKACSVLVFNKSQLKK